MAKRAYFSITEDKTKHRKTHKQAATESIPMLKASKGNILNISTTLTTNPISTMANYAASKSAICTMTRAWAQELAKDLEALAL